MTLTPAYGRDYKTAAAVRADWEADKDFIIASTERNQQTGRYINASDAEKFAPQDAIWIRFNGLTDIIRVDNNP